MKHATWRLANGSTITFLGEPDDDYHWVQMTSAVSTKPKPMTHEERRALIEAPIGRVVVHRGATSGGNSFASDGMERARRRLHVISFVQDDHDFYKD